MTIRTTKLGGTDFTDGEVLYSADLNNTLEALPVFASQDQTGGSTVANADTEIAECQVAANTVSSGVLVMASGFFEYAEGGSDSVIKLWAGTSATATSNTLEKTITVTPPAGTDSISKIGWSLEMYVTGLTWSSLNYINITGNGGAGGNAVSCHSLVVMAC